MKDAIQAALGSERIAEDLLLLMWRMHEVVPMEDDWVRVPSRNRTSPRPDYPDYPEGFDVGRKGAGSDFLMFNPWTDTVLTDFFEYEWQLKHLPHHSVEESMPPGQEREFKRCQRNGDDKG